MFNFGHKMVIISLELFKSRYSSRWLCRGNCRRN